MLAASLVAAAVLGAVAVAGVIASGGVRVREPDPTRYPVRGIDVSHHQGRIDWDEVAAHGVEFAYMKATEGRDWVDTRFLENWQGAAQAGVARGAYHFFTFCTPGLEQARHFLAVLPPVDGVLPPAVDVETAGNCSDPPADEVIREELASFLREVELAWRREAVIYTTYPSYYFLLAGELRRRPIWIRNVYFPPSWFGPKRWLLWQYTDTARIPGIDHVVDLDVLRGDRELFARLTAR